MKKCLIRDVTLQVFSGPETIIIFIKNMYWFSLIVSGWCPLCTSQGLQGVGSVSMENQKGNIEECISGFGLVWFWSEKLPGLVWLAFILLVKELNATFQIKKYPYK